MIWRKSSFSGYEANCVEVAWRKSSFSANEMNCVEIAASATAAVGVRDSKNTSGSILLLPNASWSRLLNKLGRR